MTYTIYFNWSDRPSYDGFSGPAGSVSTDEWTDVLGHEMSAADIIAAAGTTEEAKLAAYIDKLAAELWGRDHGIDCYSMARQIIQEAG